jgi:pimeloyl-ACP methyl ester carboxylesterase
VNWELIALDIRSAVRFLRSQPGITRVVLIGHSGGGPSTSYYQALSENGPSYCQGANKLVECSFAEADFLPSDRANGMVFVEAHLSNGINRLRSLNPSVVNEEQPFGPARNKTLDPFEPEHGYNAAGDSVYSQHFVDTYARGESRRMNGLIHDALEIRQEIELGLRDPADDAFVFWRDSARLSDLSTGVQCCTFNPARLLQNSGVIANPQIVRTVRVPNPDNKEADEGEDGRQDLKITSFLSANETSVSTSVSG